MATPERSRAARKEAARRLLVSFDPHAVERWASSEPQATSLLQSLLFDDDDLVRWRAVEAMGLAAAARARRDLEPVRELVRRTLWLMNDESGGLLWLGPQVIGAVLANVPPLCEEFLEILESFLEEEPFRAGTRWALWRLAAVRQGAIAAAAARLVASFADADPAVRGHAALAVSAACGPSASAALAHDQAPLVVFDHRTSSLRPTTVGEIASGTF